jgi:hypothetical protein
VPKPPARQFAAIAFWMPLIAPAVVALATGLELNSMWTMSGLTLLPVVLLSSPLIAIGRSAVRAIVMCAVLLPVLMVAAAPGVAVVTHRAGAVTSSTAHGQLLADRIEQEWRKATDKPLRLIGGDLDLAYVTSFYLPSEPSAFPVSEPQLAPWADAARVAREGIALVCHSDGRDCLHRLVAGPVDALIAQGPTGRREVVEIARDFLGLPGKPARYLIIIIPPRP